MKSFPIPYLCGMKKVSLIKEVTSVQWWVFCHIAEADKPVDLHEISGLTGLCVQTCRVATRYLCANGHISLVRGERTPGARGLAKSTFITVPEKA